MKAMVMSIPSTQVQEAKPMGLSQPNKEISGSSFLDFFKQQIDQLANSNSEEQEELEEILDSLDDTLNQLEGMITLLSNNNPTPELSVLLTTMNRGLQDLQDTTAQGSLVSQKLQTILADTKSLIQKMEDVKKQGLLSPDHQQKWGDVLLDLVKQMDEMDKNLQNRRFTELKKGPNSEQKNNQVISIVGLDNGQNKNLRQVQLRVMPYVHPKYAVSEKQGVVEKVLQPSEYQATAFSQKIDGEIADAQVKRVNSLGVESSKSGPQSVLPPGLPYLAALEPQNQEMGSVQENKVPIQQFLKYMEPILLAKAYTKGGDHLQSVLLHLQPEELGKLNVHIQNHNGQITAQFVVENATAKQAVEEQMTQLRQSLTAQGVSVQNLEVVETSANSQQLFHHQPKQQQEQQRSPSYSKGKKNKEYIEIEEEKVHRDFIPNSMGTGINYIV